MNNPQSPTPIADEHLEVADLFHTAWVKALIGMRVRASSPGGPASRSASDGETDPAGIAQRAPDWNEGACIQSWRACKQERQRRRNRPGRNRTCNPRFWRPVLYQLSYGPRNRRGRKLQNRWLPWKDRRSGLRF